MLRLVGVAIPLGGGTAVPTTAFDDNGHGGGGCDAEVFSPEGRSRVVSVSDSQPNRARRRHYHRALDRLGGLARRLEVGMAGGAIALAVTL
jgi:hypothetical protein